jgi:hypothetical protein
MVPAKEGQPDSSDYAKKPSPLPLTSHINCLQDVHKHSGSIHKRLEDIYLGHQFLERLIGPGLPRLSMPFTHFASYTNMTW